ncbi:MAG: hypothetical protein HUJ75_05280 [Parasporobacterium sp.]|nr:hypothetical protein [Parasporobacterium sp.]
MKKKRRRQKKQKRFNFKVFFIILIVIAVAVAAALLVPKFLKGRENVKYLAGKSAEAELYFYDDYEKRLFKNNEHISRGTEVVDTGEEYTENGRTYRVIKIGDRQYFANVKTLVDSKDDIIQETEKYVRTSVTVYENSEDSTIASFVKKGGHLNIEGYDEMLSDGSINMYQVSTDEGTKGWVYGKYLVDTVEEAKAVWNETGVYDTHKDRVYSGRELYGGDPKNLDWYPVEKPEFEDNPLCKEASAMYISGKVLENIDEYIKIAKANNVNCIVLDVKDGSLTTTFETAEKMAPTANKWPLTGEATFANAVEKIHEAGIYLVGRIVVFKDELFGVDHPEACIESESASQLWPSGFSRIVWEYNVKLAEEVIDKYGVNEIQFDYCRFPEEAYNMSANGNTDFKNLYDEGKSEAIQNFVFYAADCMHRKGVYLSVDVFGECAGKYVTAYGQYWPAISNVADVISGMPYTDHFDRSTDVWTDPYPTIYEWAQKAAARQNEIDTPAVVRTWITAYNVPFWAPTKTCDVQYISDQVNALMDAGLMGGFMTWNGGSVLSKYQEIAPAWAIDYWASHRQVNSEAAGSGS